LTGLPPYCTEQHLKQEQELAGEAELLVGFWDVLQDGLPESGDEVQHLSGQQQQQQQQQRQLGFWGVQ
jgi:hypothetical protein